MTVLSVTDLLHKICDDFVTVLNDSPDIEGSHFHKGDKETIHSVVTKQLSTMYIHWFDFQRSHIRNNSSCSDKNAPTSENSANP